MLQSSNPVLSNDDVFGEVYGKRGMFNEAADVTTVQGVVNKTLLLVTIAVVAGAGGYALLNVFPGIVWIACIASVVIALGFFFFLKGRPQLSPVVAPIYAIVEGVFLGAVTALADNILEGMAVGGVGVQAFIVTACCVLSVLAAYKLKIIRPTRRFRAVIVTLTGAVMLAYLVSFIMSLVWQPLPLISFASAVNDHGMMGFLGLGINIFILVLASLFLVLDFDLVERNVKAGSPKYMEWYCAFGLLVTMAWIYFEAVKLVIRLTVLFGRD